MLFTILSNIIDISKSYPLLSIILLTFLPFAELRASIPYAMLSLNMPWYTAFTLCVITNIILGIILYPLIDSIIKTLTKIKKVDLIYSRYVEKTQKKIRPYIEKYGELGLAIFIGIPLPGSGVYSGSLAGYLLGIKYKKFIISNIIGVLIAGIIVTLIIISGENALNVFIKTL